MLDDRVGQRLAVAKMGRDWLLVSSHMEMPESRFPNRTEMAYHRDEYPKKAPDRNGTRADGEQGHES
jgi:hypothetical protein